MPPGAVQKGAPYFVLPSSSEASLTSFGMFYVHCQGVTSLSTTLNGVLLFNTP